MNKRREQSWFIALVSVVLISATVAALINLTNRTSTQTAKPTDKTAPSASVKSAGTQS
jgi:hypothetical protein